jgi:DNA-binding transcriptional LysR family regulator
MERHDRVSRRLKLRDLHTLVTVVQRGSMAKAAAELACTQAAVSKTIADMERTLGVRLLDRNPRGVAPTMFGRTLLKWGDGVFEDLRHAVREIDSLADPSSGEVWIGGTTVMVEGLLPYAIDSFSRANPRIRFHLTIAPNTAYHYDELRARKLDFLIGRIPRQSDGQSDLATEMLFEEPQMVVAGKSSRWAKQRRLRLADLIDEPWVLPRPEYIAWSSIQEAFQASGLSAPRYAITSSSLGFTKAMLDTGRYLGVFPRSLLHFAPHRFECKVLPVEWPVVPPPVGIVALRNRTMPPAAALFIAHTRELLKPLQKVTKT